MQIQDLLVSVFSKTKQNKKAKKKFVVNKSSIESHYADIRVGK